MKVSIITVCYNSAATIRRTIESVLWQTYQDIEYVIVDGASKDETLQIIKEYQKLFGERMKLVSEPDKGIYDAMNKGIRLAGGGLLGILNSDDFYEPMAVEYMVNSMTDDKYQILYGFMRSIRDNMEFSIDRRSHKFLREGMINHPACFVTKAVYEDYGCFDLQYISAADYDFMLRMSRIDAVKFYPVDYLITNFSLGGMCSTGMAWLELLRLRKIMGLFQRKSIGKRSLKTEFIRCIGKYVNRKRWLLATFFFILGKVTLPEGFHMNPMKPSNLRSVLPFWIICAKEAFEGQKWSILSLV